MWFGTSENAFWGKILASVIGQEACIKNFSRSVKRGKDIVAERECYWIMGNFQNKETRKRAPGRERCVLNVMLIISWSIQL